MDKLLTELRKFAYSEAQKTGAPIKMHIDLSVEKGIGLASMLGANADVVEAGVLMMDCVLGEAIRRERVQDHVEMCYLKTNEVLSGFDSVSTKDKENILQCVRQHHGGDSFYSLESEICCNADCYRFVSINGFVISIRYLRKMPFEALINLISKKVHEKWDALTLDICRKELEPQYKIIVEVLRNLEEDHIKRI